MIFELDRKFYIWYINLSRGLYFNIYMYNPTDAIK